LDYSELFASSLRDVLTDTRITDELCARFAPVIDCPEPSLRPVHLIFAAASSPDDRADFTKSALKLLRNEKNWRTIDSVTCALFLLSMNRPLSSRYVVVSCCLLLYEPKSAVYSLLSPELGHFGPDRTRWKGSVESADLITPVTQCSPRSSFSRLIMAGGTSEPLAHIFSFPVRCDTLATVSEWTFKSEFANVSVAMLLLFGVMPNADLIEYALALCKPRSAVCTGIPMLDGDLTHICAGL
jgi:hypothetical protein